jgi:hypothetical protein
VWVLRLAVGGQDDAKMKQIFESVRTRSFSAALRALCSRSLSAMPSSF